MLQIPRIAIFKPHEDDTRYLTACFPRDDYSIRVVEHPQQILSLMAEEAARFDAIIVPPKGIAGDGGILFCTQVREIAELNQTPIIALTAENEQHVVRALYDSGVEVVISAPFSPRMIFCQIDALHRFRNSFEKAIEKAFEVSGLRSVTAKALNCAREGILLFDAHGDLNFINSASGRLLGITAKTSDAEITELAAQFSGLITQHHRATTVTSESPQSDAVSGLPMSLARVPVVRADGRKFLGMIRVLSLLDNENQIIGCAVAFTDLGEFAVLAAQVQQSHRTRSLCLAAVAGCLQLARGTPPIKVASSSALFQQISKLEEGGSSCAEISTGFLETLDLIVPPAIQVKVNLNQSTPLALKPGELFQILGHLVFEAVDFCGVSGEVEIDTDEIPSMKAIRLSVRAHTGRTVTHAPSDYFSALLQGSTILIEDRQSILPNGLAVVREILKRYGDSPITHERPNDETALFRIILPTA